VVFSAAAVMMVLGAVASPTTWRESGAGGHGLDRMANSLVGLIESALNRSRCSQDVAWCPRLQWACWTFLIPANKSNLP
jgi:hypothetical protein